ncbi:hypothetical protein M438DRAFT_343890 [Aureobasidium pullulans EXF-150]|uniref:Uncharacterized protein n=1 Tax=Aureobasidium pullulans EXF-150 TaxID=1043002 RepID=A0A074XS17_AURPU|nr:uncharacterized protein M438DRAFT_343890 [Aureobasidium pullulans EXF-150]KEQ86439.1 hypothetical protein M438DRAFT_343890 [Aureobasidium pullulans EXF-150]
MESSSAAQVDSRNKIQTRESPLKYVINPDTIRVSEADSIEVKELVRTRFDNLCKEAGWTPTNAIRNELELLAKVDAEWRKRRCETALFAFVQHLDLVWDDGYVLLGRKKFEDGVFAVGYRPLYEEKARKIVFCYGPEHTAFRPVGTAERVDEDKIWPPFTRLFDFANLIREDQNTYLIGVYEILSNFKSMRRALDPDNPGIALSSSEPPELPFLPGSKWLREQRSLHRHSIPSRRSETELRDRLLAQSQDSTNGRISIDDEKRHQVTPSACALESDIRHSALKQGHKRKRSDTSDSDGSTRKNRISSQNTVSRSQQSSVDPLDGTQERPEVSLESTSAHEASRTVMAHLMQHIELSCSVAETDNTPRVRITATLPKALFQAPTLKLSAMESINTAPVGRSRERVIRALEKIAIGSLSKHFVGRPTIAPHHETSLPAPIARMEPIFHETSSKISMDQARQLLRRARIKLVSSGNEDERGLQMFEFDVSYPEASLEATVELTLLKFSPILSIETVPIVITKTQALKRLLEYAQEDEVAQLLHIVI